MNPKLLIAYSQIADGNMSYIRGDYEETLENRKNFLKKNGKDLAQTVWTQNVHGSDVHIATIHDLGKGAANGKESFEVDALITNQKGIILAMVVADCIPLTLYDDRTKTLALVHVSRHNINQIIENTVDTMKSYFSVNPKNIEAQIGPSIGPCCYTWFAGKDPEVERGYDEFIIIESETSAKLDLWGLAEKRLMQNGIPRTKINNLQLCTYHPNLFYSHRKFDEQKLEHDYRLVALTSILS